MKTQFIQDPNDETKVIDTSIQPPSLDPIKLKEDLDKLKEDRQNIIDQYNQNISGINSEIDFKQNQLDKIVTDVPEVQVLLDNQTTP